MRDKHALREALSQATADADSRAHKCDQLSAALRSLERERELQQHKALEEREQHIAAADMRLLQARADLEDTQEREAQLRREVCYSKSDLKLANQHLRLSQVSDLLAAQDDAKTKWCGNRNVVE
jgi:hypothetical protein